MERKENLLNTLSYEKVYDGVHPAHWRGHRYAG